MTQSDALEVLKSGQNVFLTGEPGAGKTYTIDRYKEWLQEQKMTYAITASTGIAASHLDGVTIHSWSGMGIRKGLNEQDLQRMKYIPKIVERLKGTDVLIIDEVSMLDAVALNDINNILKTVLDKPYPFGGIQVVLVGDFFQLPPVSRDCNKVQFAFQSEAWRDAHFEVCYLTEQHRQSDPEFLEILTAMRAGEITEAHKERLLACQMTEKPETKLFTHNADVDHLNEQKLAELKGEEHKYQMSERGDFKYIEMLKKQCLSPETLRLKEGAVVMFTRNNFNQGYVNGTIGKVVRFTKQGQPVVETLDGVTVLVEEAEWSYKNKREDVSAKIFQLPLRLAWAITVHKSQGMSLDAAQVDLSGAFEYGQGYVAISRVRSLQGLHLIGVNEMTFMMHPDVVAIDEEFRKLGA